MSVRCKDREILKARMRADMKVYAQAIAVLQQRSISALNALRKDTRAGFQKAQRLAEHARLAYEDSRAKLNKHIAAHGCEQSID